MHWQHELKETDTLSKGRGSNGREKFWGKRVPGRGRANAQVPRWEQGWHAKRLARLRLMDNGGSDKKWSQTGATSRCWVSDWRRTRRPWIIMSIKSPKNTRTVLGQKNIISSGFYFVKIKHTRERWRRYTHQQFTWKRSQDPQAVWELVWSDGFHTRACPPLAPTWTKVTEVYPN